jgi:hypothetical protein
MWWHRELVRRHWTYQPSENIAPNALDAEVVALVLGLARELALGLSPNRR